MITIEGPGTNLAKVDNGKIAKPVRPLSVGELELALLKRFPREDAESWDRMGLLVGDPACTVKSVAVALDPTRAAVEAAYQTGSNVLVTHHPAFIDAPEAFSPSYEVATAPGVNVWTAASRGVALMNFHTALDVSVSATRLLPSMLSLDFERIMIPLSSDSEKGYGQLCSVSEPDRPFRLSHLAARCTSVFGRAPRVWGDFAQTLERVAIANGSAGPVVAASLKCGADCLVCGEIRYHAALEAAQAGLCIIELGHDVSEIPLVALLAQAVVDAGVAQDNVRIIDQNANWMPPESTRI